MSQIFAQGYGVVIGVGEDLPVTVDDASAVAKQLQDPSRCAYPKDQIKLLTEANANRAQVLSTLNWLSQVTGPEDTAVIYFSGHGIQNPDYHLLTHGYDLHDLENTTISGELFTQHLQAIRSQKLLVLLDCCHAGGQAEAKGITKSPLPPSVVEQLGQNRGRVILASSRKDELSRTGDPYSVFTAALLEGLAGYGAFEPDGYARVLDVAMWLARRVPERTQDQQHPIIKINQLEDNFAVAWYAGGEKSPRPLPNWDRSRPSDLDSRQIATWRQMWSNYRENLLLIEERMSEYVNFTDIPLQDIKNKRRTEEHITELERKLGLI